MMATTITANTPSYEGYYYARIIFISNVPYYVDDDRYIRPIPPRLHDHFRRYPYNTLGRAPVFSPDREVRDGYPVSSIIYLDGVPYHVGNDRNAQPLPERLQPRFRYTPNQGNAPAHDNRRQQFEPRDDLRKNEPPAFGQDRRQDRGQDLDSDRHRDELGPIGPDHERPDRGHVEQPPIERGPREGGRDASVDSKGRLILSPEPGSQQLRQDRPNAGASPTGTTKDTGRDRNGNRPQAVDDSAKKKADKKEADKNKSRDGKKDKKGDSTQADDGSKNDNSKKSRDSRDGDPGSNDRGNSNRRD